MSNARRIKREKARIMQTHFNVFGSILMGFYEFLEQKPKPSDEEVRNEFITREQRWKQYCKSHKLTEEASLLFNKEVSISWEKRYTKKAESASQD